MLEPLLAAGTWPELPLSSAGRAALQPSVVGFTDPAAPAAAGRALELRLLVWRTLGALCAADSGVAARAHAGGWTRLLAAWVASGVGAGSSVERASTDTAGAGTVCEAAVACASKGWSASQARALRRAALEALTGLAASCPAVRTSHQKLCKGCKRACLGSLLVHVLSQICDSACVEEQATIVTVSA